jgi:non-specific protein-tyrosine kinase
MELRQYIAIGLKWWWLIILLTLVAAITSYAVSQRQPAVYEATTTLIVGQSFHMAQLDSRDILTSERLALTYADVARRQPVLQQVVDTLDLNESWQVLKERVKIQPVQDTQLLEITVEATSPEEAQVTANEIAHQLILLSPTAVQNQEKEQNQRFVRQRLESLQAKIEAGQARLETLEAAMAGSLSAEQVQELQAEINDLDQLITDWENIYTQLLIFVESEKSPNYLAVVEPAQAKPDPVRPRLFLNTLLAGAVGCMLALGLIFLLEYLDDTIKSGDELSQTLGVTCLGGVGRIKGRRSQDKLLAPKDPLSHVTEAYRLIRSNIQFLAVDQPLKAILVTSSSLSEGKSTTVANLAAVMAQSGLKTVIVDADLRRPIQHQLFDVDNCSGLTGWLLSPEAELEAALSKTDIENLRLLTSGALPPNPADLLGSQRMGQLLAQLNELADVVIYDSPPLLNVSDALVLANRLDGVILVIEAGRVRREVVKQAFLSLQQANANLLGGVLNRVRKKGGSYYQGYYRNSRLVTKTGQRTLPVTKRRWQWLPFLK